MQSPQFCMQSIYSRKNSLINGLKLKYLNFTALEFCVIRRDLAESCYIAQNEFIDTLEISH